MPYSTIKGSKEKDSRLYKWAQEKGIFIDKKRCGGPKVVYLGPDGKLSNSGQHILFAIVVPEPEPHELGSNESFPAPALESHDPGKKFGFSVTVAVNELSGIEKKNTVKVGDVIIVEMDEVLQPLHGSGLCFLSLLHEAEYVRLGQGGWKSTG
jgi:hypothetical protein